MIGLIVLIGAGWWWTQRKSADAGSGYRTTPIERGDIRVAISATGTLSAISTVTVGSQISGQVTEVPVSYTHLDVYKRQVHAHARNRLGVAAGRRLLSWHLRVGSGGHYPCAIA